MTPGGKLTCAPDVTTSETTTAAPIAVEPAVVTPKSIETPAAVEQAVLISPLSDPLARYVPLSIRRIPSDEDWLMNSLKPNEA